MDTVDKKISYAIGYRTASQYMKDPILELDQELLIKGIRDAAGEVASVLTDAEIQEASQVMQKRAAEHEEASSAEAKAGGDAFLAENKGKDGVEVTESGLQFTVLTKGDSDQKPVASDSVKVHYHGMLIDGTVFDSSVQRGEPISFPLGGVIKGWTEGLQHMSVGDKFRFFIPSDLAYGARATGSIPAHSALIFDVELLGINDE